MIVTVSGITAFATPQEVTTVSNQEIETFNQSPGIITGAWRSNWFNSWDRTSWMQTINRGTTNMGAGVSVSLTSQSNVVSSASTVSLGAGQSIRTTYVGTAFTNRMGFETTSSSNRHEPRFSA